MCEKYGLPIELLHTSISKKLTVLPIPVPSALENASFAAYRLERYNALLLCRVVSLYSFISLISFAVSMRVIKELLYCFISFSMRLTDTISHPIPCIICVKFT